MKSSTLFVRAVPQDRDRGWMLLVSWEKPVIQRTCMQIISMSAVTQTSYEKLKQKVFADYNAEAMMDVTPPAIARKMAKQIPAE